MFCSEVTVRQGSIMRQVVLSPIPVWNVSCHNENVWEKLNGVRLEDVVKSTVLLLLALTTIIANLLFVLVLRNRRYHKYIHVQPRYFLAALAYNSILSGCSTLLFSIYSGIMNCWPYGDLVCQAQAVLQGALNQHYCVLIMSMGVDRYWSLAYPHRYSKHSGGKVVGVFIMFSWFASVAMYTAMIVPSRSYYFDSDGSRMCEPFYGSNNVKILAYCVFYFLPTLVLMYCYGSVFHSKHMQAMSKAASINGLAAYGTSRPVLERHISGGNGSDSTTNSSQTMPLQYGGGHSSTAQLLLKSVITNPKKHIGIISEKHRAALLSHPVLAADRRQQYNMARTMAAISISFIVVVTPWTLKEVVVSCTGTKLASGWDFLITCFGVSYILWNPLLYWLFNAKFRMAARQYVNEEIFCQRPPDDCCSSTPHLGGQHRKVKSTQGVGALFGQLRPMLAPAIMESGEVVATSFHTLPHVNRDKGRLQLNLHSFDNGALHSRRLDNCHRGPLPIAKEGYSPGFIYPITRAVSTPKLRPSYEELGEKYWGEILEKSLSQASLHRPKLLSSKEPWNIIELGSPEH